MSNGQPSPAKTFFTRGRLIAVAIAGLITFLVTATTGAVELWDRFAGQPPAPTSGPATHNPVDVVLWESRYTGCSDFLGKPPTFIAPSRPNDTFTPSSGDIGHDYGSSPVFSKASWVSEQVLDIDAAAFSLEEFARSGAYPTGSREVRMLLVNRSDEPMVVTDMAVQVERRPAPAGTLGTSPGGDPSPIYVMSFDLGKENPVAQLVDDDCKPGGPFFSRYVFEVPPKSSDVVYVELNPGECLCLVRLRIKYRHRGQWRELTVPEAGKDPIPVVAGGLGSGTKYSVVYVDNSFVSTPNEKHDCRRQSSPLC